MCYVRESNGDAGREGEDLTSFDVESISNLKSQIARFGGFSITEGSIDFRFEILDLRLKH